MYPTGEAFVGQTFGEGGHLVVVSVALGTKKTECMVKCSVCEKDTELFGDGVFKTCRSHLLRGCLPCGCAFNPKWTKAQYLVKIKRICAEKSLEFLGCDDERWKGASRLRMKCLTDGHTWDISINKLLMGQNCPKCAMVIPDDVHIAHFRSLGVYPDDVTFTRTNIQEGLWDYHCPTCAEDEFSKVGVCDGTFKTRVQHLRKGHAPCRCQGAGRRLLQRECEYLIHKACKPHEKFLGWVGKYSSTVSKFSLLCDEHGPQITSYSEMSEISNVVCPKCRKIGGGFRKDLGGYVYVLLTKGNSSFTGYGITNHIASRMATHRRNLSRQGIEVEDWAYGVADGHTVAKIESFLKKNFPLDSQNIDGFRTEATHSYLFEYAVDAVHKLLSSLPYPVEPVPTPEVVSFVQSRLAALSEASKEPCSAEEMCSD